MAHSVDRALAAASIDAFLRAIGRDPASEHDLRGTGARVADAFIDELCVGYTVDVDSLLATNVIRLSDPSTRPEQLVAVRGLSVSTMCPHHLMPATGTAEVFFLAGPKLLGLGAVGELVDALSRRLTLQETIGEAVVDLVMKHASPRWALCRLRLSHGCMVSRGGRKHGSFTETVAYRGRREERAEAMNALASSTAESHGT